MPGRLRGGFRGRRLAVPTRLLYGARDPLGTGMAAGLERHGDDARVEYLDACGHFVPEERPEAGGRGRRRGLRLISWNVARRVARLGEQAEAVAAREPDVVALQEITVRTWPMWREALGRRRPGPRGVVDREPGRMGVLLASRAAMHRVCAAARAVAADDARARRSRASWSTPCTCRTRPTAGSRSRRSRASAPGLAASAGARLLCGDLNTPRRESPDGTVMSFARDSKGRLREERGERWDRGELGVVPGLAELGFADALRTLHGYGEPERSWTFANGKGGWRLDHVFARRSSRCSPPRYHHDWRAAGLSDHAAFEADVEAAASVRRSRASSRVSGVLPQRAALGVVHQRVEVVRAAAGSGSRPGRAARGRGRRRTTMSMSKYGK